MELHSNQLSVRQRKADAHEKIQLGGLIVKAGLREMDRAILLGALMDVKKTIEQSDAKKIQAWRSAGIVALKQSDKDTQ